MNDFLSQIEKFSNPGQVLEVWQISSALIITALLCLVIAKTYEVTFRGVSYSPAFMHTLVICGMVIAAVMVIIGSNIARAFSLVGALSIIRFRNAVKDPRDVAYIFLTMGVGMAVGTGFYRIGVTLTLITSFVALLMSWLSFGSSGLSERMVRIVTPAVAGFESLFSSVLDHHSRSHHLISTETLRGGSELELAFALRVKPKFSAEKLTSDLLALNPQLKVLITGTSHVLDL